MTMKKYNVKDDDKFITFCNGKNLTKNSRKKYAHCLKNYTNYNKLTLKELLDEADKEEETIQRMKKRNIRNRLINFRTYLLNEKKYETSTIITNMNCAKAFYRFNAIEVPEIPQIKLPSSPNEAIEFEDLPTRNIIKTAIEGTKLNKHKALFLFSFTTGSARMELTNFTFQQFLDGLKPYTNNAKTPQDIIEQLDGKCEEKEIIPIFRMRRQKTEYYYHTATTPECVQFMINYLKTEGLNLKPEDKFFQLTEWGVSTAFKLINQKFRWGKRGTRDYFSSHRIRSLHASLIEDKNFANYLEGRKPDPIEQAYFKRDINRIREKYKKHMHKFTIYATYNVMINSEAYKQLREELEKVNKENIQKDKKIKELEARLNQVEIGMPHLKNANPAKSEMYNPKTLNIRIELESYINRCRELKDKYTTRLDKKIQSLTEKEKQALIEISFDIAINDKKFKNSVEIKPIIEKAFIKMRNKPEIIEEVIKFYDERNLNNEKLRKYHQILYKKLEELDLWDKEEIEIHCDNIAINFNQKVDKILIDDITEEYVQAEIEKYIY